MLSSVFTSCVLPIEIAQALGICISYKLSQRDLDSISVNSASVKVMGFPFMLLAFLAFAVTTGKSDSCNPNTASGATFNTAQSSCIHAMPSPARVKGFPVRIWATLSYRFSAGDSGALLWSARTFNSITFGSRRAHTTPWSAEYIPSKAPAHAQRQASRLPGLFH
jgi:hypothetical protein